MKTAAKNILFTTWEGGGNLPPVLTVARKLRERGHTVRLMSDEANREEAESTGLAFHPWKSAPNRPDKTPASCPLRDWEADCPQEGIGRVLDRIIYGPALEYGRDLAEVLDRDPADLVVTSEMLVGVLVACEARSQPVVILAANLCMYPMEGMPLFGPGLPPPRTGDEDELHETIRAGTIAMLEARLEGLNRARLAFGLLPLDSVLQQLDVAGRYYLATSRAFDFPTARPPSRIRYIGPHLDEPAWVAPWRSPWPPEDARPLVLVGFSTTYQAHENVVRKVMDAAADLPVRLLVTLGQLDPGSFHPPPNAVLVPNAPHNAVMERATVVVTHGGHGTVMRALRHHRPILVIPHGRDQDENAVRVVEHGAGLRLTAAADVEEIRDSLRSLLEQPEFASAAARLGSAIREESSHVDIAGELEALADPAALQACEI